MTTGTLRAIGLMSGTSMDGIDVALVESDGLSALRRGPTRGYSYDAAFRARLAAALETAKAIRERGERPGELAGLATQITDRHAHAVRAFAADVGIDLTSVDVVGFHGQTVLHRPQEALTVQLGDGVRLAATLGRPVVHDMRAADMRAGGQGAPLVPIYHAALSRNLPADMLERPVVFVNIGGISNITFVPSDVLDEDPAALSPIAFDSGPGNALLDQWVAREAGIPFDAEGAIASEGGIIDELAAQYLTAPFFSRPSPKSLDRFDFRVPPPGAGALDDVARTLCAVAAGAILKSAEHLPKAPKLWIISGGGRRHPAIMQDLRTGAAKAGGRVVTAEEAGFDGDGMEAEAWAYLAIRCLRGLPLTFPGTTGCRAATLGGVISLPD